MNIEYLFPTVVARKELLISKKYNDSLIDRALEIYNKDNSFSNIPFGNTKHTKNIFDIANDEIFFPLLDEIHKQIHEFAKIFGCKEEYNYLNSWLNFSDKDSYQEYHNHPNSTLSCVYYLKFPQGSANLIFKSPKNSMISLKTPDGSNPINWGEAHYKPTERSLFMFRSDLEHRVPTGENNDLRISIAINWN